MPARALVSIGCFALAFGSTCWVAGRCLPFPEIPEVSAKLRHLAARGDDYEVLFLGSSRVELQVVPAAFDQRMAELGRPLRSFNAGVSAMTPPEDAYFFDQIANRPHRQLRWVIIELGPVLIEPDSFRAETARLTYWHDLERTLLMERGGLAEWSRTRERLAKKNQRSKSWSERWAAHRKALQPCLAHMSHLIRHEVHLGQGAALLTDSPTHYIGEEGWMPTDGVMTEKNRLEYQRLLEERRATPQGMKPGNPAGAEAIRRLVQKVIARGATPVLLVPPTVGPTRFQPPEDIQKSCTIIDFSDIAAYPELFQIEHRLDAEHLNSAAAPLFSRLLAERFFAAARPQP
jgi:hypothetical protein